MKVTVITGSPHKNGTSALLADEFIRGAQEAGWETVRFDAAFESVMPCLGCDRCRTNAVPCVQEDGMAKLVPELLDAQAIALVTPLYYFGFSTQIKRVIDRFYAYNQRLAGDKKAFLLAAAHGREDWMTEPLTAHYRALTRYLRWEDGGVVLATGCGVRADIENTNYPQAAYELGRTLGQEREGRK